MSWSIEEAVSFITMIFTIPTFILALWSILRYYRRSRSRRLGHLLRINNTPSSFSSPSPQTSPIEGYPDLETGWIQFNHITTSTISRSGSFRIDQRLRRDG
ncbi:hypothetical protein BDW74DRAFT_160699 [Aspergillus multicolor]|uniref:uncharacterized protein n=1 Tax=Aspergillus multicolor TaxID=41759 RepID=UPI003CCDAFF9